MKTKNRFNGLLARAPLASAVAFALLAATPAAQAFEFEHGELTGSWDTTVSYGISVRVEDIDSDLIGKATINPLMFTRGQAIPGVPSLGTFPGSASQIAAPGRFSVNRDDGNLKYAKNDAFSNAFKITSELSLKYHDWGFFTRGTTFYDIDNSDRHDLSKEAQDKVSNNIDLLDAFVYRNFALGASDEVTGTIRFGRQVVSWGESTFIQNGINVINPIDVSKLRVAGAELKEAFLPVQMIWGSIKFSEDLSLEGFYQFDWQETEIDAAGTYFSANDFASPGGTFVMLGFGTAPSPVGNPDLYQSVCFGTTPSDILALNGTGPFGPGGATIPIYRVGCGAAVTRLADRKTRDSGQFGFALRWYSEALNETEFGFYGMNYHSRLPLLSGRAVTSTSANSGRFFVEYPEDLKLFGMSWNTTLPGGVAWQGEISYRPNAPLQVDDVELLFAALTPINAFLGSAPSAQFVSQLGSVQGFAGDEIKGWRSHKVTQLQMTFTKAFAQVLGADQIALVGELGATEVWDLPAQSVLRYEGEGTDTGGGCDIGDALALPFPSYLGTRGCFRNPNTQTVGFPTQFSWGYRLAARADYNSVFGTAVTLSPRIAFNHDVNGITPGPGGNFLEGRMALTLGLEANYLNNWVFDLSYSRFSGGGDGAATQVTLPAGTATAGPFCPSTGSFAGGSCIVEGTPLNQLHDRDFVSFSVKYSF